MKKQLFKIIFILGIHTLYASEHITLVENDNIYYNVLPDEVSYFFYPFYFNNDLRNECIKIEKNEDLPFKVTTLNEDKVESIFGKVDSKYFKSKLITLLVSSQVLKKNNIFDLCINAMKEYNRDGNVYYYYSESTGGFFGCGINQFNKNGINPLIEELLKNNSFKKEKIKKLIKSDIDLDFIDKNGKTALTYAQEKKLNGQIVYEIILRMKKPFNYLSERYLNYLEDAYEQEELHSKFVYNHPEVINYQPIIKELVACKKFMYENNCEDILEIPINQESLSFINIILKEAEKRNDYSFVNTQDENGITPIMHAIINQNVNLVKNFLELGADLNIKDSNEESIFEKIKNIENPVIKEKLISTIFFISNNIPEDIDIKNIEKMYRKNSTIFSYISAYVANLLSEKSEKHDSNIFYDEGNSHKKLFFNTLEKILKLGFDPNNEPNYLFILLKHETSWKRDHLNLSIEHGYEIKENIDNLKKLFKEKLRSKDNINAILDDDRIFKSLLGNSNINDITDENNEDLLVIAIKNNSWECINLLRHLKADFNKVDKYDKKPVEYFLEELNKDKDKNYENILRYLCYGDIKTSINENSTLLREILKIKSLNKNLLKLIDIIIEEESEELNIKLEDEKTLLMKFCSYTPLNKNLASIINRLIKKENIDLNEQDINGNTALMTIIKNHIDDVSDVLINIINTFLKNNADLSIYNNNGESALLLVLNSLGNNDTKEKRDIAISLINNNVDNIPDNIIDLISDSNMSQISKSLLLDVIEKKLN